MYETNAKWGKQKQKQGREKEHKYEILTFEKRQMSNWTVKAQADNIFTLCDIEMVINTISIRFEQDPYN